MALVVSSLPSPRSEQAQTPPAEPRRGESMTPSLTGRDGLPLGHHSGLQDPRNRKTVELTLDVEEKITCTHPDCAGLKFDRRCEWSKHMDKHERPYVCTESGCEKLRGFTYSGGLLRHKREVHKKYGGPKVTLMCPFPFCKRNRGTGFTRKENLTEHIRRVHRSGEEVAPEDDASIKPDPSPYLEEELPVRELLSPQSSTQKSRKRKNVFVSADYTADAMNVTELQEEIKKLQRDHEEKDDHIVQLRREIEEKDQRLAQLEFTVTQTVNQLMAAQQHAVHPQLQLQQHQIQHEQELQEIQQPPP